VSLLADQGRELLPYYRFEPDSGLWKHREGLAAAPLSLHDVSYANGAMAYHRRPRLLPEGGLSGYLEQARRLLDELAESAPSPLGLPATNSDFEHLRWFPYPDEV
jgi:hypothetical protein